MPGADLEGIHYLRTLADCDTLRERLEAGGRVAVIGAGWIGSEFAASARQRGLEVTLIDPLKLPNERVFGSEIGSFYRDVHAEHGVRAAARRRGRRRSRATAGCSGCGPTAAPWSTATSPWSASA